MKKFLKLLLISIILTLILKSLINNFGYIFQDNSAKSNIENLG